MIGRGNWRPGVSSAIGALVLAAFSPADAAPRRAATAEATPTAEAAREAKVAAIFAKAVQDPLETRLFLAQMPKGGDLHNHLSGALWAEDMIGWAREAGYCRSVDGLSVEPPPSGEKCPAARSLAAPYDEGSDTPDRLINSLSTRGWQQGVGRNERSGHRQFFQTFSRFGDIADAQPGRMLAAELAQAARDHLSYLELDHNPETLGALLATTPPGPLAQGDFPARYAADIAQITPLLPAARAEIDAAEADARSRLACNAAPQSAPCAILVRYLFQALRAKPPGKVFRSLLLGFAMADADPRYVGVNIVMPEDAREALEDYDLHMAMIAFLASKYPKVHLSLHAGELAPGLVPPRDMADHIAKAVAAGAQRIGHGVDIAYEAEAEKTLATMAKNHIAVEINLSSNDVILGVRGADHPVNLYRHRGVPIVLATDDQGILRTDMTREYTRAAREQGFTYRDLKQAARAAIEFSFLPGESLWAARQPGLPTAACAPITQPACQRLIAKSDKARAQADLEAQFAAFERDKIAIVPRQSVAMSQ